jgi:hypothetical protein
VVAATIRPAFLVDMSELMINGKTLPELSESIRQRRSEHPDLYKVADCSSLREICKPVTVSKDCSGMKSLRTKASTLWGRLTSWRSSSK